MRVDGLRIGGARSRTEPPLDFRRHQQASIKRVPASLRGHHAASDRSGLDSAAACGKRSTAAEHKVHHETAIVVSKAGWRAAERVHHALVRPCQLGKVLKRLSAIWPEHRSACGRGKILDVLY